MKNGGFKPSESWIFYGISGLVSSESWIFFMGYIWMGFVATRVSTLFLVDFRRFFIVKCSTAWILKKA